MAVRRIPLPWDGQPQEVGDVDWGNSLLQDAEFVMLGSQIFWNPLNRTLTRVGGQEGGVTSAGLGQRLTTTQYLSYPASVANGGTGPWTLAGLFMPVSGATDGAAIAGMAEAPGSSTFDRSIRFLAGTYEWGAYLFDGGAKSAVSGVVPVNGRTDCVIGTTDGSSTLVVAANGREGSVAVTSGGFAGYTSAEICLGQANNISLGTMLVPIFVRTRGYWSASQRASFLANPWQVFAPRSIWAPVSARGGGTSVTGILGTAAASGFTATIGSNRLVSGALGTAAATGYTATISTTSPRTVTGVLGTAVASGFTATIGANRRVSGVLGTATATGYTATVSNSNDRTVNATTGTATAIGYTGFVNANRTIAGNLGTAVASGFTGTVQNGVAAEFSKNANLYLGIGSDLSIVLGNPRMPSWNTTGRPSAPLDYVYGFNTDTHAIEVWNGASWV